MPLKQNSLHTLWACCHHWASQMTFHPKLKMIWNISLMWIFSTYRNKSKSRRDEGETDWSWCGDGGTHRRRRKRHILNPKIQMCPILPHQLETRTAVPFRYFQSGGGWHEGTKWVERMSCRAVMRRVMLRDRQVWSLGMDETTSINCERRHLRNCCYCCLSSEHAWCTGSVTSSAKGKNWEITLYISTGLS